MAFTLNKKVQKVVEKVVVEKKVEEKPSLLTQLEKFYDLACLSRREALQGYPDGTHSPKWYIEKGILYGTLCWLRNEGYIGKNVREDGKRDVYVNWEVNKKTRNGSKKMEQLLDKIDELRAEAKEKENGKK